MNTHRGVRWMSVATAGARGAAFVTNVVVGYFVTREDFGVVALALAVLLILAAMRESGLGQALVREPDLDATDERRAADTVFWILFASNAALATAGILLAPALADLVTVGDPGRLVPILRAVLALLVVDTFLTVPRFLLLRHMRFRALAGASTISALAQTVAAVIAAALGAGAWALVVGHVALRLVHATLLLRSSAWWPRAVFDRALAARLFRFGKWLWAFTLVSAVGDRLDRFLLGAWIGEATVGIYAMALAICQLPVKQIGNVVQSVAFPAFSRMEGDRARMATSFERAARLLAAVAMPAALGIHAVADAFVGAVLAERWQPCVPIMQVLAFHGLMLALATPAGPVLNALGRSRAVFAIGVVHQVLGAGLLASVARYGIDAVARAVLVPMAWSLLASYAVACRSLGLRPWPLAARFVRIGAAAAGMDAAVVWADGAWLGGADPVFRLVALLAIGAVVYPVLLVVADRATAGELARFAGRVLGLGPKGS